MGIRLSDKYLVYSVASVFEMISSPAFNVSMFIWSLPVAVLSSYLVVLLPPPMTLPSVPLLGQCLLWCSGHFRVARCNIPPFVLWFYLDHGLLYPARSLISLSWPSFCVLLIFLRLFDAMIVSRMISRLYFLMSSHALFLMVLHISAYSVHGLSSPFSTISRLFVIRDRVGDDILDFSYLLIALATLDALCWVVSVMVSLMASRSCSFSNRCLNSCRNSIFFDPIYGYMVLVASSSSIVSFTPLRPVRCCP